MKRFLIITLLVLSLGNATFPTFASSKEDLRVRALDGFLTMVRDSKMDSARDLVREITNEITMGGNSGSLYKKLYDMCGLAYGDY